MRATKGLWAAVGAGTSLAAAAVLALFCVSLVLAVHGWPQVSKAPGDGAVALQAQVAVTSAASAASQAPEPVVLAARAANPRSTSRRAAALRRRSARRPAPRRPGGAGSPP